jgi:aminopeptidase
MTKTEEKLIKATKDILEKNMTIKETPYSENEILLIYDLESPLSTLVANAYIKNLENIKSENIDINTVDKEELIKRLWALKEHSTVILVQSTNFRLDNFRIRLQLHNNWVWCLGHNHLLYMKDTEYENYADAIEYLTPYYDDLSLKLKILSDKSNLMKFVCNDWSTMVVEWWVEDMKQNTWNYEWKKRGWTLPIWENFTEAKNFDLVNWELSIIIYPRMDFQIYKFDKPIKIKIKHSFITCEDKNAPKEFLELLELIKTSEDNEVMLRELWFGLNPNINNDKQLADVNFFERKAWFHVSIWKKHQIYRKKIHKDIVQRYHIDIFPDIKEIYIDDVIIFENDKYLI